MMSWNCHGMGNDMTVSTLSSFLRASKPSILFLSETKLNKRNSMNFCNSLNFRHHHFVPSIGKSGGLALFWQDVDLTVLSVDSKYC